MNGYSKALGAAALFGLAASPALAQTTPTVNKTWVASAGVDSGSCPLTAPCKTFDYAIGQTSAGGEVDVKDSGGYGTFTVAKSISIVAADGILATINVPSGGVGIKVSSGLDDIVYIKGLTVDGHHLSNTTGIVTGISSNHIEIRHCDIRGMTKGIDSLSSFLLITSTNVTGSQSAISNSLTTYSVYLDANIITGNFNGVTGNVNSYGNNVISGNSNDTTFSNVALLNRR